MPFMPSVMFAMSMETEIFPPQPVSPPQRRRAPGALWLVAIPLVLLAVFGVFSPSTSKNATLIWLTPAEFAQAMGEPPPTSLRYKLRILTGPIKQLLLRNSLVNREPIVRVDSNVWLLSPDTADQLNLGLPTGANTTGKRVWILTSADFIAFRQRLNAVHKTSRLGKPVSLNVDRIKSQASMGSRITIGDSSVDVGLEIKFIPGGKYDSINLMAGVTDLQIASASSTSSLPNVNTNIAVALTALIPNSGALVIDGGKTRKSGKSNFLVVLSPVFVDPKGTPIKP